MKKESKRIVLNYNTWNQLRRLKAELELKTFEEVVSALLKECDR